MNDTFYELLVKQKTPAIANILKVLVYAAGIFLFLLSFIFGIVALIVCFAFAAAAYFFILPKLSIEYEYSLLNTELNIDIIYNQSKRKKADSFDIKHLQAIFPADSDKLQRYTHLKAADYSAKDTEQRAYAAVFTSGTESKLVFLQLDEKILEMFKYYMPRAFQ